MIGWLFDSYSIVIQLLFSCHLMVLIAER